MIERTFITQLIDKLVNAERAANQAAIAGVDDPAADQAAGQARRDLDDAIDALHEMAWQWDAQEQ